MRQVANLCVAAMLASLVGGCVVVDRRTRALSTPKCHPSQYWDGSKCKHKGKGNGARKHDGPGKGNKRR